MPKTHDPNAAIENDRLQVDILSDMIISSLQKSDNAQARQFAEEIHNLETRMLINKNIQATYQAIWPIRIGNAFSLGAFIGSFTLLALGINSPLNSTFLTYASIAMIISGICAGLALIITRKTTTLIRHQSITFMDAHIEEILKAHTEQIAKKQQA